MDHEAFHNEVEGRILDNGHGRGLPVHICNLTSKKSYFMLDKAIVCIGCDVCADDGYTVRTVIDNRLLEADEKIIVNGEPIEYLQGETTRADIKYIYFEKAGAYYFPEGGKITVRFYEKAGARRVAVFFEHGLNPVGEKYAYIILPGVSLAKAQGYDLSDIEITRNDSEIQAVKELHSGLVGVAFRGPYEIYGIKAEEPMIAMAKINDKNEIVSLAAADPTQLKDSFAFTVIGANSFSCEDSVTLKKASDGLHVSIKCDSARGRAYRLNR